MEKFIELVKAGKIEGLFYDSENHLHTCHVDEMDPLGFVDDADHLCAHIRRWLSGKGYGFSLSSDALELNWYIGMGESADQEFSEGSELDWHLAAACWVCEREQTGEEG